MRKQRQWLIHDVQLTYKKTELPTIKIVTSDDAARVARAAIPDTMVGHREFFGLLLLNRANYVLRTAIISIGGMSTVVVDPKIVIQTALLANAAGIVLFHNHPSNSVKPSVQDMALTKRIAEICRLMEISLLDHVIIGAYQELLPNYYSFADNGEV